MLSNRSTAVLLTLLMTFSFTGRPGAHAQQAERLQYFVAVDGDDAANGLSPDQAFRTLQFALERVVCGSIIQVADGRYSEDIRFDRADCLAYTHPIEIVGLRDAVFNGAGHTYIFEIMTGHITLSGFTIDGEFEPGNYRKKLIYTSGENVERLVIAAMTLRNAREECVRLRLNARHNIIRDSTFDDCGRVGGGTTGDNREAIYIGSAESQQPGDATSYNWILNNTFNDGNEDGTGSECVDIKENAHHNVVEGNFCYHQNSDPEAGGINIQGTQNIVINNVIEDNAGSGIRIGSGSDPDEATEEGRGNTVRGNTIRFNDGYGINMTFTPTVSDIARLSYNCIDDNGLGAVNREVLESATDDCDRLTFAPRQ